MRNQVFDLVHPNSRHEAESDTANEITTGGYSRSHQKFIPPNESDMRRPSSIQVSITEGFISGALNHRQRLMHHQRHTCRECTAVH